VSRNRKKSGSSLGDARTRNGGASHKLYFETQGTLPEREIKETISPAALTTGSFPFLDRRISSFASLRDTPSGAVRRKEQKNTE
jgi:hypothetical protein